MRLVSRTRSPLSSSWVRVHSRSSTTTGADACTRRRHCGSVRSAEASTRASRRSSLAPAGEYRSRNRSSCFGLIACTARPCASKLSTTGPRGVSIATPTVSDDAAAPGPSRLAFITICGAGGERAGTSPAPTARRGIRRPRSAPAFRWSTASPQCRSRRRCARWSACLRYRERRLRPCRRAADRPPRVTASRTCRSG